MPTLSTSTTGLYLGSTPAVRAYYGSTLVYGSAPAGGGAAAAPTFLSATTTGIITTAASSMTITGVTAPAGTLLVHVGKCQTNSNVTAVSDTQGNTWVMDVMSTTQATVTIWHSLIATALSPSDTITATLTAAIQPIQATVLAYQWNLPSVVVDSTAQVHQTSGGSITLSGPTTQATSLVLSAGISSATSSTLVCSVGTERAPTGSRQLGVAEEAQVASGTTINDTWSGVVTNGSVAHVAYRTVA